MNILKFVVIYVVVLVLGIGAVALGVPQTVALTFFTVTAIVLVIAYMYAMTSTRNTKLTKFAIKFQKKSPMFAYVLAVQDGTLEDELAAIALVEKKVKNEETVLDYQFLRALRLNNLTEAKQIVSTMKTSPRKRFNIAILEAALGKYGVARGLSLDFIWMEYYVEAYVANMQGNKEKYEEFMQKTIDETKGLQKLTNEALYQRDLREWDANHQPKKRK
ncbi:hypothetical protein KZO01_17710 [Kurthia zopfii]|uniref:Uncharacterized protein n=1 Tax=Kurthia zopfii TaxID=1650 RepID=A0A2U3AAK3_9BACL|nr:hypothetical protein [Kurthia zopfii]PWI21568.1 hypothetical protein DF281_11690 [Kurthia zopfii]TDR34997.1 hypothetical protein DFR61_13332 [Kurthia zopfii]STX09613.1 Uncharacterised protein [Kurthia zopfii]VEI08288.1 Uncharacterised protein [Kurthia zopfii]GEK31462.1 hypothetical protein KZO01_17710 [Kurthia zopfii]